MTKNGEKFLLFFLLLVVDYVGCGREEMGNQTKSNYQPGQIPRATWKKLSNQKMFFGHMSVGANILEGVTDLSKEVSEVNLRIVESTDPSALGEGAWLHSAVGKNTDPFSKFADFERAINNGLGSVLDVAFLKLCYVDIVGNTDVEKVFSSYRSMVERINKKYPSMKLVHFTPPLTRLQTGPKAWLKDIIGKPIYGVPENIKRTQYADLLKTEYADKNAVFDLAAIEATRFDGSKVSFSSNGKNYPNLLPEYTDDWGHLNRVGRKWVAEKLLIFLGNL